MSRRELMGLLMRHDRLHKLAPASGTGGCWTSTPPMSANSYSH